MAAAVRLYDRLIVMLALVAGIMVTAIFVIIVVDVSMRTLGMRPPAFSSAVSEYMLLYITMFAAPWLVRERGHVRIDSFVSFLPQAVRRALERLIILVCVGLCLVAAYYSTMFAIDFWVRGTIDIRSIEIPRSFLFFPLTIGFSLCAVEFLRMLAMGETLSRSSGQQRAGLEGEL